MGIEESNLLENKHITKVSINTNYFKWSLLQKHMILIIPVTQKNYFLTYTNLYTKFSLEANLGAIIQNQNCIISKKLKFIIFINYNRLTNHNPGIINKNVLLRKICNLSGTDGGTQTSKDRVRKKTN